uniref:CCR4-NOT transcription complex subunit 1-like NOT1 connector domain-containing protein n=1 Tax=Micrurus lemniscatus lemniscatus TaxID=129467 RepID=A0A2D4H9L0_MICLE
MKQAWATDDVAQIYDKCMAELEQHLQSVPHTLAMNPQTQALRSLLEAVVVARNSRDAIAALGLLQKAVEGLLDATSGADADLLLRYRECHLLVLKALQDGRAYGSPWCNKQITRSVIIMTLGGGSFERPSHGFYIRVFSGKKANVEEKENYQDWDSCPFKRLNL